jgi:hypothetical protein
MGVAMRNSRALLVIATLLAYHDVELAVPEFRARCHLQPLARELRVAGDHEQELVLQHVAIEDNFRPAMPRPDDLPKRSGRVSRGAEKPPALGRAVDVR